MNVSPGDFLAAGTRTAGIAGRHATHGWLVYRAPPATSAANRVRLWRCHEYIRRAPSGSAMAAASSVVSAAPAARHPGREGQSGSWEPSPAMDKQQVRAHTLELLIYIALDACAGRHERDDGPDADDEPSDRQHGAQAFASRALSATRTPSDNHDILCPVCYVFSLRSARPAACQSGNGLSGQRDDQISHRLISHNLPVAQPHEYAGCGRRCADHA